MELYFRLDGEKQVYQALGRFTRGVERAFVKFCAAEAAILAGQIRAAAPVATGELRGSIQVGPLRRLKRYRGKQILVGASHALWVHQGSFTKTKGKRPPYYPGSPLSDWSAIRGGYAAVSAGGLARFVARHGIEARPFVRPQVESHRGPFLSAAVNLIQEEMRKIHASSAA